MIAQFYRKQAVHEAPFLSGNGSEIVGLRCQFGATRPPFSAQLFLRRARLARSRAILEVPFAALLRRSLPGSVRPERVRVRDSCWGVVQLVGHLTVNEDGEGSNPSAPANLSKNSDSGAANPSRLAGPPAANPSTPHPWIPRSSSPSFGGFLQPKRSEIPRRNKE